MERVVWLMGGDGWTQGADFHYTKPHPRHKTQGNIAVSVFKFAGELIAMFSMDRVGRKPLFVARCVRAGVVIGCG